MWIKVFSKITKGRLNLCIYQHRQFCTKLNEYRRLKMDPNLKFRENPVVLKLDNDLFKSIFTDELNDLVNIFNKHNYEIRIAGGAVRDILMEMKPKDLDFATTATPSQMKEMFEKEQVRMINMNGEKHGTITARMHNKENFECTTLRIDVVTDGRHAEVEFTTDWLLDANRRDLTVNAMFLGFDGSVYDYFYGYEDLMARKIRFVGDATRRIQEDYLRILRYFRFYGRIATKPNDHEQETLDVITKNAEGLERISGERLWVEVRKILQGNYAGELMTTLVKCGIAQYIGLPEVTNLGGFQEIWNNRIPDVEYNPITLLCGLLHTPDDALKLHERLKFSAYERDLAFFISQCQKETKDFNELIQFQKLCFQNNLGKTKDVKDYVKELLKFHCKHEIYHAIKDWEIPKFSINGRILTEKGCPSGKIMGVVLNKLKEIWVEDDFKTSDEELLKHLPKIYNDLNIVDGKQVKKPKTDK